MPEKSKYYAYNKRISRVIQLWWSVLSILLWGQNDHPSRMSEKNTVKVPEILHTSVY